MDRNQPLHIETLNNNILYNRNTMCFEVVGYGTVLVFESYNEAVKGWKKAKAQRIYVIHRMVAGDLFFSTREKAEQYVKEHYGTPTSIQEQLLDVVE